MSELAFNANGESFEVPATVTGWRVRRMKPRGAPELVYGQDGRPLTISVDADMDELRDAVGGVLGRYRLDPINDEGRCIDSVPPAVTSPVMLAVPPASIDANPSVTIVFPAVNPLPAAACSDPAAMGPATLIDPPVLTGVAARIGAGSNSPSPSSPISIIEASAR